MLNEVTIEGMVTRDPWTFDKDLFFRIASYRDSDVLPKPDLVPGRDEPDYINVRVPGGAVSLASPQRGMRLRIHGFLQSREYKESLTEFLRRARADGIQVDGADKMLAERNTVEVVAHRVVVTSIAPAACPSRAHRSRPGTGELTCITEYITPHSTTAALRYYNRSATAWRQLEPGHTFARHNENHKESPATDVAGLRASRFVFNRAAIARSNLDKQHLGYAGITAW